MRVERRRTRAHTDESVKENARKRSGSTRKRSGRARKRSGEPGKRSGHSRKRSERSGSRPEGRVAASMDQIPFRSRRDALGNDRITSGTTGIGSQWTGIGPQWSGNAGGHHLQNDPATSDANYEHDRASQQPQRVKQNEAPIGGSGMPDRFDTVSFFDESPERQQRECRDRAERQRDGRVQNDERDRDRRALNCRHRGIRRGAVPRSSRRPRPSCGGDRRRLHREACAPRAEARSW